MTYHISIIIPVYNKVHDLSQCLDSILRYKNKDIEIIIVDDTSTDNSCDVVNDHIKKDHRVSLLSNPKNMGTYLSHPIYQYVSKIGEFFLSLLKEIWH
ncbi:MAG: glycosyltransferase family 2 protein [Brevinema sp.]